LAVLAIFLAVGCDPAGPSTRTEFEQAAKQTGPDRKLPPAPKTIGEVENLGVPVYPGTTLAEGEAGSSLRTSSLGTTYTFKMYAPAEYGAVAKELKAKLKDSIRAGAYILNV
jgi:hypothetical protein